MSELIVQDISSKVAAIAVNYSVIEFVNGQQDCRDGIMHMDGNGESYDAGYRTEYELQQINSAGGFN